MPLKFVPGVARVAYSGTNQTNTWANIFHVAISTADDTGIVTDPWSAADMALLPTFMRTLWTTHLAPLISAQCTLRQVVAVDLTNEAGQTAVDSATVVATGGMTATIPAHSAQCISWKEVLHYRGGHLRTYLPPPDGNKLQNSSLWTTAHGTAVVNGAGTFRAAIAANTTIDPNGLTLVGVHRYRQGVELQNPIVTRVTGETFDLRIDSQRRRLGADI